MSKPGDKGLSKSLARTVLAGVLILSASPLLIVEMFPEKLKFVMEPASYLVFHNIAEFFSILVSLSMFGISWYTYEQSKNRHALFLGTAFLAIGLMDFMHTLSMPSMPDFITPNDPQKSIQFWMPVRIFQALAFLASAYVYPDKPIRWLSKRILITSSLLVSSLVFIGIIFFQTHMPIFFIVGIGVTPLKKFCEYLVIFLLCIATAAYWRRMERTGDRLLIYYMAAFVFSIFSGLSFALYATSFDTYNVLGHINKIVAFFLIYYGIYRASVKDPYLSLVKVSENLKGEIAERKRTEEALREARNNLEVRVEERTAELVQSNAQLRLEVEDHQKAEEALREAHGRALWLARFPDENPNPIVRVSANGTVLYCNPSAVKLPGWTCAVGQPLDDRLLPLVSRAMLEGKTAQQEAEIGRRVYSAWVAPFPGEGYANVYGWNITERKKAEEESRIIIRTAMDGFWLTDTQGHFLDVNDAYCRLIGYSRDELLTMRIQDVEAQETSKETEGHIRRVKEVGWDRFETRHRCKDGRIVDLEVSVNYLETDGGRFCVFLRDITERKRAEEVLADRTVQLERLNRELAVLNADLDDFTRMASHDLQEPLRTLTAFSDLLPSDLGRSLPERAARDLRLITDAAKRMRTLIHDLLALSRAGRAAKKREKVSLSECANRALEALAIRVKETGAQIIRDKLPDVWGDSTLLTELYQNLIGNALKFKGDQPPIVQLSFEEREGEQIFGVKDNGIGIEPQYAQQIFEPFRRLHGRAEYEGSGIGLAICRKIVERHGGKIWVESEPGKGAHFRFTISHRMRER